MHRRLRLGRAVIVGLVAVTAVLAGCGEGGGGQQTDANGVASIKVGYIPIGIYSYFWQAEEAGYFEEQDLEVELVPMAGGGEIIPALQSNSLQFGISDALGVLNARNGGIEATYVTFNFSQDSEEPTHGVLTNDPSVTSPADLSGKTVATNLSYNTDWTMMREWLRGHGVDPESVEFQELPFPDMLGALRNGTVAAAGVAEPFYTQGEQDGMRVLGNYFTDVRSPVAVSGVVALDSYIEENGEVVERFVTALDDAVQDFQDDPETAREIIGEHTEIDPELVETMRLGQWEVSDPAAEMQFWIDAARNEGVLDEEINVDDLIWKG